MSLMKQNLFWRPAKRWFQVRYASVFPSHMAGFVSCPSLLHCVLNTRNLNWISLSPIAGWTLSRKISILLYGSAIQVTQPVLPGEKSPLNVLLFALLLHTFIVTACLVAQKNCFHIAALASQGTAESCPGKCWMKMAVYSSLNPLSVTLSATGRHCGMRLSGGWGLPSCQRGLPETKSLKENCGFYLLRPPSMMPRLRRYGLFQEISLPGSGWWWIDSTLRSIRRQPRPGSD